MMVDEERRSPEQLLVPGHVVSNRYILSLLISKKVKRCEHISNEEA